MTHHATDLILPGGANITTAAGDEAEFIEYATGDYRCTNYSKADGTSVVGGLDDNSVTLAKMAGGTDGNLITYDASGDPAYVTTGTSGQVLTSGGTGVAPTFQTAAGGGGKLLQAVQFVEDKVERYTTSTSYTDTGLSASITPTLSTSKILLMWHISNVMSATTGYGVKVLRDSTAVFTNPNKYDPYHNSGNHRTRNSWTYLDSPATTSSITYKVQTANLNSTAVVFNESSSQSSLLLMEIGV